MLIVTTTTPTLRVRTRSLADAPFTTSYVETLRHYAETPTYVIDDLQYVSTGDATVRTYTPSHPNTQIVAVAGCELISPLELRTTVTGTSEAYAELSGFRTSLGFNGINTFSENVVSGFVPGSLGKHCTDAINAILAQGRTQKTRFSTLDLTNNTWTGNAACWFQGDLSCLAVWNSTSNGPQRGGTLITPRHIVMAMHYPISNGATLKFAANDGTLVARTLVAQTAVGHDILIGVLDADLPATVAPVKVLNVFPWPTYIKGLQHGPNTLVPWILTDQENKILCGTLETVSGNGILYGAAPANPLQLAVFETIIVGDSGHPVFMYINGEPVLAMTFFGGGGGSAYSLGFYYSQVLAAISTVDAAAGHVTGYVPATPDLSSFNTYA